MNREDAYAYFESTKDNSIDDGYARFYDAFDATKKAAGNKPVWVTETGWPVSGNTSNKAVPSIENAKKYWDQVGCSLFNKTNTWWFTLQDAAPETPSPSFGLLGNKLTNAPLWDLTCSAADSAGRGSGSGNATTSGMFFVC